MDLKPSTSLLLLLTLALLPFSSSLGDEIKMKNGDTLTGKITYESDSLVKIEMAVSGTIKQTRTLSRADIEKIIKDAPDNVAFGKIQDLLPTPPLLPASRYKALIEIGPTTFLRSFPDSRHVPKVKEVEEKLRAELDQVERGFIKLDGEWISPQERAEYEALTSSKIALFRMQTSARARNYSGYINALRQFEILEEQYYGSPAFPVALKASKEVMPAFGSLLRNMLRNVEYLNQQYEQNLAAMDEISRVQVAQARQNEIDNYKAGVEADKKEGIKWVRMDPRSKEAIESYIALLADELKRIQVYEIPELEEQAGMLVRADQQASAGELGKARAILSEASAVAEKSPNSKSSKRGSGDSYFAAINAKIEKKEARLEAQAKAREEAFASESLTANLKPKSTGGVTETAAPQETDTGENPEDPKESTEPEEVEKPVDDFAALASPGSKGTKKSSPKGSGKSENRPKPKEKKDTPEKKREAAPPEPSSGGGGISITRIIQIATGLLLITVVAIKFLGKKD